MRTQEPVADSAADSIMVPHGYAACAWCPAGQPNVIACVRSWDGDCIRGMLGATRCGGVMSDFVRYELEDGSEVYFESAEGSLVSLRSGSPDVVDAGRLGDRLQHIAAAAAEVSKGLRERLAPEEIELDFGGQGFR